MFTIESTSYSTICPLSSGFGDPSLVQTKWRCNDFVAIGCRPGSLSGFDPCPAQTHWTGETS